MSERPIEETLNGIENLSEALEMVESYSTAHRFLTIHEEGGKFMAAPEHYKKLTGYSWDQLDGQTPYAFFHEEDLKETLKSHASVTIKPTIYVVNYRNRISNGSYVMFRTYTRQLKGKDDKGALVCITEYLGS